jgi:hypothetical protein
MKTSFISRWSIRDQHFSSPSGDEAVAWVVSSGTAGAILFAAVPKNEVRSQGLSRRALFGV